MVRTEVYQGYAYTEHLYTHTVVPSVAAAVIWTCLNSISSSSIGWCLAQPGALPVPLLLLQSTNGQQRGQQAAPGREGRDAQSTMPHPLVDSGSVNPVLLQGMMIVLLFIILAASQQCRGQQRVGVARVGGEGRGGGCGPGLLVRAGQHLVRAICGVCAKLLETAPF